VIRSTSKNRPRLQAQYRGARASYSRVQCWQAFRLLLAYTKFLRQSVPFIDAPIVPRRRTPRQMQ
jgi:hypothetical protein